MKIRILISLLLVAACHVNAQLKNIKVEGGTISGLSTGEVAVFKGIPFAAPPVADLRWKAPKSVQAWKGVKKCEAFSASPVQPKPVPFNMWTEEFIAPPQPLSEDCLYLNVWTAAKSAKEKRPVFVWIYGGGFVSGSAGCAVYDGEDLAKRGVVFVSINYRVGPFGFLVHPELNKESGHNVSGNYGILDQIAALTWIQKNIAAFGGDPVNVTIAGQSAGSFSVNALVASPLAKGLFHRAIAQSGSFVSSGPKKKLSDGEATGQTFLKNAGVNSIAELRQKSAEEIQKLAGTVPFGSFAPVYEDYVLPSDPVSFFKAGKHNDVPVLIGWVTGDGALRGGANASAEKFKQDAADKYGEKAAEFLKAFPASNDDEAKASQLKLGICQFAAYPGHIWATSNKQPVFLYQFNFVPTDKPGFPNYGAFHTSEVPYALHTLHKWNRPWQPRDLQMEETMSGYWINFIKKGNPNGPGLPEWKSYDSRNGAIMEMSDVTALRPALFELEFAALEFVSN